MTDPARWIVVHATSQAGHDVREGVWCGARIAIDELPERAHRLLLGCVEAGAELVAAPDLGLAPILAVHDERLVETLSTAHDRWVAEGHTVDPGAPDAIPYLFPGVAGRHGGRADRPAATVRVELGRYATDTLTPVGAGTWRAALGAAHAATHAADLVLRGAGSVYAACRPPGHHAGPAFFGGSCYLSNAAIAARRLSAGGCGRVAVLDVDAHHGNGTQAALLDDPEVWFGSLHVDPGAGWYPHTVGYADELGPGDTNHNRPLPPGTSDEGWLAALDDLLGRLRAFAPEVVVVSAGVDASVEDPNSPLRVSARGFSAAGERIRDLGAPTVWVQEGGYALDVLADHTLRLLGQRR